MCRYHQVYRVHTIVNPIATGFGWVSPESLIGTAYMYLVYEYLHLRVVSSGQYIGRILTCNPDLSYLHNINANIPSLVYIRF